MALLFVLQVAWLTVVCVAECLCCCVSDCWVCCWLCRWLYCWLLFVLLTVLLAVLLTVVCVADYVADCISDCCVCYWLYCRLLLVLLTDAYSEGAGGGTSQTMQGSSRGQASQRHHSWVFGQEQTAWSEGSLQGRSLTPHCPLRVSANTCTNACTHMRAYTHTHTHACLLQEFSVLVFKGGGDGLCRRQHYDR